jgi:predicted MPP superfamily phosphohydrolase
VLKGQRGERKRGAICRALALTAGAAAVGVRAAWVEPRSLVIPEEDLAPPGWPAALDGLRVALVSDVHAGAGHMTPGRLAAIVDRVLEARADVHLLLGDYLDSTGLGDGRARVLGVAEELARLPGAVAVLGNHDWRGAGPAMGWALRAAGVRLLENDACELRPGLWAAGIADTRHRVPDSQAALRRVPEDAAVLFLTHDPDFFPDTPARAELTVAGHLHGGQVNVPILRLAAMPTAYGDRYLAGHVVEEGRHLYVSAGLGTAGLPLRLFRRPEVPVLRLTSGAPRIPAS